MEYSNRTLVREAEAAVAPKKISSAPAFVMRLPIMQVFTEAKDALDSGQPSVVLPSSAIRFPMSDESNGFFFCIFKKEVVLLKQDEEEEVEAEGEEGEEKAKGAKKKPKKATNTNLIPLADSPQISTQRPLLGVLYRHDVQVKFSSASDRDERKGLPSLFT
ncbi:unnamed protein product [Dibothriocephalus latus]|uniref:Uncharacterized protein n=1 Tax=Dibothriocephalus latus TaxID=60516 RepID=A0A3P7NZR9_DIBLA|nr:unnamed protein product [Dibothriocephalus latus]